MCSIPATKIVDLPVGLLMELLHADVALETCLFSALVPHVATQMIFSLVASSAPRTVVAH